MTALQLAERIGCIDSAMIQSYSPYSQNSKHRKVSFRRILIAAAALVFLLTVCGFAAFELRLFDPWRQTASTDPVETVKSAVENQIDKTYTIMLRIDNISIDVAETQRMIEMYSGSDFALSNNWSEGYLQKHFIAVRAKYYVEYDHTKTFLDDGNIDQYFYLVEDLTTGEWTVIQNSSNGVPGAE